MTIDDFSLKINNKEKTNDGYVELDHGQTYHLFLHNHKNKRCAAQITIDGKDCGTFRIKANSVLVLERPSGDSGKFTFYKIGTNEFNKANLNSVNKNDQGLISVIFKPEKTSTYEVEETIGPIWWKHPWSDYTPYKSPIRLRDDDTKCKAINCCSNQQQTSHLLAFNNNRSAGATGLSGNSNQRFKTVSNLDYVDPSEFVTINLRLISSNDEIRELKSITTRSNKIPLPV